MSHKEGRRTSQPPRDAGHPRSGRRSAYRTFGSEGPPDPASLRSGPPVGAGGEGRGHHAVMGLYVLLFLKLF